MRNITLYIVYYAIHNNKIKIAKRFDNFKILRNHYNIAL